MGEPGDQEIKEPKEIVRTGYDRISEAYRAADFDYETSGYKVCLAELLPRLSPGARVLDLGCGCGVPVSRVLAGRFQVTGVDFSPVQIERARQLVPDARFLCADMTSVSFEAASFDAIVSFFALIHIPLEEQTGLFERLAGWLKPGGLLLATVGHTAWTGTEPDWKGALMYWSHADAATYRRWLANLDFRILWETFLPEEDGGHTVILAQKRDSNRPDSFLKEPLSEVA